MGELMDPNPRYLAEKIVDPDAMSMGATAERLHDRFPTITKERADRYAYNSQMKTAKAYEQGLIQRDLIPTAARSEELGWTIVSADEGPRPTTTMEGLAGLKTPFMAIGSQESSLMTMTTMRATTFFISAAFFVKQRGFGGASKRDIPLLAGIGIADFSANLLLGVATTKGLVSIAMVLGSLYPIATAVLAYIFLHERLHKAQQERH